ncbi:MAG: serine hydrolase domain-containing protein, partial [Pyrinomonadaceae bacterium]
MKKKITLIAIIFITCSSVFSQTEQVENLFEPWNKTNSPGVAVSIVKGGKVIYQKGFGVAVLENNVPITPKTIFQSASVSKQFTAFAILLLAQQGKLKLEDDVRKHLSEVPDFGKTITIRHLLNHTSGLRDQAELAAVAGVRLDDVLTQVQVLKIVQGQKELNFNPGEEMVYCNTGYTLLAEIVAKVSGKSFRQFTEENIFKPLEMNNTHFHDDYVMVVPYRASSYFQIGADRFIYLSSSNSHVGATNLMTTAEDFAKWLNNFESGKVGGKELIAQMRETGYLNNGNKTDYGAGFDLETYRGLKTISHAV